MMEEHFMRGWADGHERLSADVDRGLGWLRAKGSRFVEAMAQTLNRRATGEPEPIHAAKHR